MWVDAELKLKGIDGVQGAARPPLLQKRRAYREVCVGETGSLEGR